MIVSNRPRRTRLRESGEIVGFADLYRQLEENLPKATQLAVIRRAGKAAMQPMQDRIEELAPVHTGMTRASVRATVRTLKASVRFGAAIIVQVGAGSRDIFWPRFSEHGTIHEPARPFIRPAFDEKVREVIELLKAAMRVEILKAIARRAKRLANRG